MSNCERNNTDTSKVYSRKRARQTINQITTSKQKSLPTNLKQGIEVCRFNAGLGKEMPSVELGIEDSNWEKLINMLTETFSLENAFIYLSFNDSPRSSPTWYKASIFLAPLKENDKRFFFKKLTTSLKDDYENSDDVIARKILNIYQVMRDRETPLKFRIVVSNGYKYTLSIECLANNRNWKAYTKMFTPIGFTTQKNRDISIKWKYTCTGKENIEKALEELNHMLRNSWDIEIPKEITEDMDETSKALVMRRKFGTDEEGVKLLNNWLNENKLPNMKNVYY